MGSPDGVESREFAGRGERLQVLMTRFSRIAAGAALVFVSSLPLHADGPTPAITDERAFLEEVKRNLKSDETLLEQYTFTEKYTERKLNSKGAVKETRSETYEVYPSLEPGKLYRRLIARDGVPLSEKRERLRAEEETDADARARRAAKDEARAQRERAVVDEVFRMDDIQITGRGLVDGRDTVIVTFAPRPGYKPVTKGGKVIQKLQGTAWIDAEDRELVRLETRLVDTLGVGPAKVARLQPGSNGYFQRRKVNNEIWLPASARFEGAARLLLVFGGRVEVSSEYGDYKKFSVATEEEVAPAPGDPGN
jgi:hypothetical protein